MSQKIITNFLKLGKGVVKNAPLEFMNSNDKQFLAIKEKNRFKTFLYDGKSVTRPVFVSNMKKYYTELKNRMTRTNTMTQVLKLGKGKNVVPLTFMNIDDKKFSIVKKFNEPETFLYDGKPVTRPVFVSNIKKYYTELKTRMFKGSLINPDEILNLSEELRGKIKIDDPVFQLSRYRISNKTDDRWYVVNGEKITKARFVNKLKNYILELRLRSKNVLKQIFSELLIESGNYKTSRGDYSSSLEDNKKTYDKFEVNQEDIKDAFDIIEQISAKGLNIICESKNYNGDTLKSMAINVHTVDRLIEKNDLMAAGSDVFELIYEEPEIFDYTFFLIPLISSQYVGAEKTKKKDLDSFWSKLDKNEKIRKQQLGNMCPYVYTVKEISQNYELFNDVQAYNETQIAEFKDTYNKGINTELVENPHVIPCFIYSVTRYLNKIGMEAVSKTFSVPVFCRNKYGYVPLVKIKEICELNNINITLRTMKECESGKKKVDKIEYKCGSGSVANVNLCYCRKTEHFFGYYEYQKNQYLWEEFISSKPGYIKSSMAFYNKLSKFDNVRRISEVEKYGCMGVNKFNPEEFEFTDMSLTCEAFNSKIEQDFKICDNYDEFCDLMTKKVKSSSPVDKWKEALLITFDFETYNCKTKINKGLLNLVDPGYHPIKNSCDLDIEPMSISAFFPKYNYFLHLNIAEHGKHFESKFLDLCASYYERCVKEILVEKKMKNTVKNLKKLKKNYPLNLVAHNLYFDLNHLIKHMGRGKCFGSDSNLKAAHLWYNGLKFNFFNSCNFFPGKLANVCEAFDINVEKEVFPYNYYNNKDSLTQRYVDPVNYCSDLSASDREHVINVSKTKGWMNEDGLIDIIKYREYYNNLDCDILYKCIMALWKKINEYTGVDISGEITMGNISKRIQQAYGCFNGTYKLTNDLSEFFRLNLTGGRVCLKNNKPAIYLNDKIVPDDINSLYPAAMSKNGYKLGKPKLYKGESLAWLMENTTQFYIKVNIIKVNKHLGLPFLNSKNSKNVRIYSNTPVNNMILDKSLLLTLINSHEIEYKDVELISGMYYDEGENKNICFLTKKLYELRMQNKGAVKTAIKLILNAGYGKLAQKSYDVNVEYCLNMTEVKKIYHKNPIGFISSQLMPGCHFYEYSSLDDDGNPVAITQKWKVTSYSSKILKRSSYAHEAFHVLSTSKLICSKYQKAYEEAGFDIAYTDTDSFHLAKYTPEKYEAFKKIYKKNTGEEVSHSSLGGVKSDFEPKISLGETLVDCYAKRAVYLFPKTYYEEVSVVTKNKIGEIKESLYPHIRCKGIKQNALIIHAALMCNEPILAPYAQYEKLNLNIENTCKHVMDYYGSRCMYETGDLKIPNSQAEKEFLTIDNCYGNGFNVKYVNGKAKTRTEFKRKL